VTFAYVSWSERCLRQFELHLKRPEVDFDDDLAGGNE
jgi:hypothetical protein